MTAPRLHAGSEYGKDDLERLFGIRFGYQITGIVVRRTADGPDCHLILIFSKEDGPYDDSLSGDELIYDGAGLRGDQKMSGVNRILAEHGQFDPLYCFRKQSGQDKWTFLGMGRVADHTWTRKGGRKVIEYRIMIE